MHLTCTLYLWRPLFSADQLDLLQSVVNDRMPDWSQLLRATSHAGSKSVMVGRSRRLLDCVQSIQPTRWGIGSVELVGTHPNLTIFLSHSDSSLPPDANRLSIEILDIHTVEGRSAAVWATETFTVLTQNLPTTYANARLADEFSAKNIHNGSDGTWAIGVQLLDYLPGLYWMNYFGQPYCELMGRDRVLAAPGYDVRPNRDGVIVSLAESPEEWDTPAYRRRERDVIEHLGKPYFFSRDDPKRESLAPDFRAIHKRESL